MHTHVHACKHKFQELSQVWQIAASNQRKWISTHSLMSHPTIGKEIHWTVNLWCLPRIINISLKAKSLRWPDHVKPYLILEFGMHSVGLYLTMIAMTYVERAAVSSQYSQLGFLHTFLASGMASSEHLLLSWPSSDTHCTVLSITPSPQLTEHWRGGREPWQCENKSCGCPSCQQFLSSKWPLHKRVHV